MTSKLEQIAREHGAPRVRMKGLAAAPGTTTKSEGTLEGGDVALDAGAEVPEASVGGSVAGHLGNREAEVFAEHDVSDAERSDVDEIAARREAAIKHDVTWRSANDLHRSFDSGDGESRVPRVARQRLQIENQPRGAGRKADLVTVERFAAVFDDHVGVRLEDRNDFLLSGNLLVADDATHRLVDDALREQAKVLQFAVQLLGGWCGASAKRCDDLSGALERARSQLQDFTILGNSKSERSGAENLQNTPPDAPNVIDESRWHPAACPLHQPHEQCHAVTQQRRVGRMMDVGVDDGAVDANLRAVLDAPLDRLAHDHPVDHLEGCRLDALDIRLQRGALRCCLAQSEATEATVARRVLEMKREFLVAEAVQLLDDQRAKHLLAAHRFAPGTRSSWAAHEIFMNPRQCPGNAVQDPADRVPFAGVDVVDSPGDKSELSVYFLAHRSVGSFGRSWRNSEKTRTPMLLFPSQHRKFGFVSDDLAFLDEN
jgi:hypothetical protein